MPQDHRATIRNAKKAQLALRRMKDILEADSESEDLQKLEAYKRRLLEEAIKDGHAHGDRVGEPVIPKGRCPLCHDAFEDDDSLIWRCGHFNRQMHAECLLTMGSDECHCRANLRQDLYAPAPRDMRYWSDVRKDLRVPPLPPKPPQTLMEPPQPQRITEGGFSKLEVAFFVAVLGVCLMSILAGIFGT